MIYVIIAIHNTREYIIFYKRNFEIQLIGNKYMKTVATASKLAICVILLYPTLSFFSSFVHQTTRKRTDCTPTLYSTVGSGRYIEL